MRKIISIFVPHQGCPQRCIFCHQPYITGVSPDVSIGPQEVRNAIDTALQEPRSRQKAVRFEVAFYGGTFTGLPGYIQEQLLRTAEAYVRRGDLDGIRLSTHPAMFDDATFVRLQAFAVTMVEVGVQSFDNQILRTARRGHSAEEAEAVIRRLHDCGMGVGIHLMVGLPGDTHTISLASAQRAIALQPEAIRIHPTLIFRHTALETLYQQQRYTPWTLDESVTICKAMLQCFRAHQIPVIRIGLQPTDSMRVNLVAGPYHPAFRQLVEAELMYDQLNAACRARAPLPAALTIFAAPPDISTVRGQKNANISRLQQRFHLHTVRVLPDAALSRGDIRLEV